MTETEIMNKIIREHYPVDRLPDDLRSGLPDQGWVRTEIEPESAGAPRRRLSSLVGSGRNVHGDADEVIKYLREMREDR